MKPEVIEDVRKFAPRLGLDADKVLKLFEKLEAAGYEIKPVARDTKK